MNVCFYGWTQRKDAENVYRGTTHKFAFGKISVFQTRDHVVPRLHARKRRENIPKHYQFELIGRRSRRGVPWNNICIFVAVVVFD